MMWRDDLPERWEDAGDQPPQATRAPQDVDVFQVPSGTVFRSGQRWVAALEEGVVVDLESAR